MIKNQLHAILRDLNLYLDDTYNVINEKIFYKEGDGLSDKIHYGYRTMWAYYHEFYKTKRVKKNELINQSVLNLVIANFSYSKLPDYFHTILGVSGTLESMSYGLKEILNNNFQVKRQFVQPSIYPPSNRTVCFRKITK